MDSFFSMFFRIMESGGVLMLPLLILAFYLYYSAFSICFRMLALNRICSGSASFAVAYGNFIHNSKLPSKNVKLVFARLRSDLLSGVERRLHTLKLLSGVPPLIGLLGTVSGMMLSISSAAGNSAMIADGISSALITTQAGLVVAIPAWIMAMFAASQVHTLLITLAGKESNMIKDIVREH